MSRLFYHIFSFHKSIIGNEIERNKYKLVGLWCIRCRICCVLVCSLQSHNTFSKSLLRVSSEWASVFAHRADPNWRQLCVCVWREKEQQQIASIANSQNKLFSFRFYALHLFGRFGGRLTKRNHEPHVLCARANREWKGEIAESRMHSKQNPKPKPNTHWWEMKSKKILDK